MTVTEFNKIARQVGMMGIKALRNLSAASKNQSAGKDGNRIVAKEDVKKIFRKYEVPGYVAEAFFDAVDEDGKGYVDYSTFAEYVAGHKAVNLPDGSAMMHVTVRSEEDQAVQKSARVQNKDDVDFRKIVDMVSHAGAAKYGTMKSFVLSSRKFLGNDKKYLSRIDVRIFFRQYGFEAAESDKFFDRVAGGYGECDTTEFMSMFAPHLDTGHVTYDANCPATGPPPPKTVNFQKGMNLFTGTVFPPHNWSGSRDSPRPRRECATPGSPHGQDMHRGQGLSRSKSQPSGKRGSKSRQMQGNFHDMELQNAVKQISAIAASRHGQSDKAIIKAFMCLDSNDTGSVTLDEVKVFFRNHGFSDGDLPDRFWDKLDVNRTGKVDVDEFKSHFALHIQPGHTTCRHLDAASHVKSDGFDGTTTYRTNFYERELPP